MVKKPVILRELDQSHFGRIARHGGTGVSPPRALGIVAVDDRIEEWRIFLGLDRVGHAPCDHQAAST